MSLAELLIYTMLSLVVLAIGVGMFVGTASARTQVMSLTSAATSGELISRSIEEGVRNAGGKLGELDPVLAVGIKAEPVTFASDGVTADSQLMRARVAVGSSDGSVVWQCRAWFYSGTAGAVFTTTNATGAVADPGNFTQSDGHYTAADGSNWLLLGEGVTLPAGAAAFFGAGNSRVILRFQITQNDVSLVLIPNTVVQRSITANGTGPDTCY